jgi:thioredoxin-like negative regulator of GroEL
VTADAFDDFICAEGVVVHFWAPWNPHDRVMDQHLKPLMARFPRLRFYSVNMDDTAFSTVVEQHHVAALPALLCFHNGRVKGRFYGVERIAELEAFLREMAEPARR